MKGVHRRGVLAVVMAVVLALVVLWVVGRDHSSARLEVLRRDPLGLHVPVGGRLAHERAQSEHTTLGKPVPARLERWFHLSGDPRVAIDEAARAARDAGWRVDWNRARTIAVCDKVVGGRPANAVIELRSDPRVMPSGLEPPALSIVIAS